MPVASCQSHCSPVRSGFMGGKPEVVSQGEGPTVTRHQSTVAPGLPWPPEATGVPPLPETGNQAMT